MARIRLNKKRLTIDLPITVYMAMKENAVLRNITVTKWITDAILMRHLQEKKYE